MLYSWLRFYDNCEVREKSSFNFSLLHSGEVRAVKGIDKSLSVGQVVWSPSNKGSDQYLIFVGWSSGLRKLGIKYCYNRPCALYAVRAPHYVSETNEHTK